MTDNLHNVATNFLSGFKTGANPHAADCCETDLFCMSNRATLPTH